MRTGRLFHIRKATKEKVQLWADESVLMVECSVRRVLLEADRKLERGGW